jgi:hypothetical protein
MAQNDWNDFLVEFKRKLEWCSNTVKHAKKTSQPVFWMLTIIRRKRTLRKFTIHNEIQTSNVALPFAKQIIAKK